jgi:hypothetical protein
VVADTADTLREQLVGDWWQATGEHGADAVMVAARRSDIDDLNARARSRLAADGQLAGRPLEVDAGRSRSATGCCACATTATSGSSTAPAAPSPASTTGTAAHLPP